MHSFFLGCPLVGSKGQLNPKCLFGNLNSPNKRTKFLTLLHTMVPQVELFSFFLGELKTPKRHFEIN